jgi:hypothetical protein
VEAAFLSREQLQNLNQAACKLGKGVEEIVADIKHHLEQLAEDTPAAREEAIREAVQQWMSKAAAAGAVTGPPSAGGQRAALDRAMEVLEEGQEDLTDALREGEDVPAQQALRLFEVTVTEAVAAGVDVRWLSTWREHTAVLPAVIQGLPELPFLDESVVGLHGPAPGERNYSGPWKVDVAKACVPDEVPLLWTEDSPGINLLSETWRSSRRGPTKFIQPRTATGLVQREIREIREWIARHGH